MTTRIILVDTRPERGEILVPALEAEGIHLVGCVSPNDDLLAAVFRFRPDVMLIDIDSPDRDTLEGSVALFFDRQNQPTSRRS